MSKLITIPRGIYTNCTITGTHSISYPSYRGFSLSANSLEALFNLVDLFWCPSNRAGITSTNTLNTAIANSLEDTCPIIHIDKVA